jgi:hypothetical protein
MRLPSFIPLFIPFFGKRSALQRLAAVTPIILPRDAEAETLAVLEELRAAPLEKRVKTALDAGLPQSALKLGPHAGTVLAFLLDDDLLREAIGHAALLAWLLHDRDACIAHAIAHAHRLTPLQLWTLLIQIEDASEIYDVFAPVYRARGVGARGARGASGASGARALLAVPFDDATARRVFADPRIVDLALETISNDVRASCTLLGFHASARAVDELRAVLERVPHDDEESAATEDDAIAAIDALANALAPSAFVDVLASFLSAQPQRLVPHMYLSMRIAQYATALDQHPLVRANHGLRMRIELSAMPPPMPVG